MKGTDDSALRIGAWRVDPTLDEVSKDGNTVKLEHQAMRLLVCLAEHAGEVASVEQLLDEAWGRCGHTGFGLPHCGGAATVAR